MSASLLKLSNKNSQWFQTLIKVVIKFNGFTGTRDITNRLGLVCWSQILFSGRENGWWLFDDRTSKDIEEAFLDPEKNQIEISIGGFVYTVDFETMTQFRTSDHSRKRKLKREYLSTEKDLIVKGVAGLRLQGHQSVPPRAMEGGTSRDNLDSSSSNASAISDNNTEQTQSSTVDQITELTSNLQIGRSSPT